MFTQTHLPGALDASEIGPLAKLLTRQTAASHPDDAAFIRTLSESIPDPLRRSAFVAAMHAFASES